MLTNTSGLFPLVLDSLTTFLGSLASVSPLYKLARPEKGRRVRGGEKESEVARPPQGISNNCSALPLTLSLARPRSIILSIFSTHTPRGLVIYYPYTIGMKWSIERRSYFKT